MRLGCTALVCALALSPLAAHAQTDPQVLFDRGALRKAATLCEQKLAANANDAASMALLARIRAEQDRFDEAMKLAEKAVAIAPKSADAHLALSEVNGQRAANSGPLSAMGAAKTFKREAMVVLELDPANTDAMVDLIEFHRRAPGIVGGDKKQVGVLLDRLEKVSPVRGLITRANIASAAKDSAGAERLYRKAVDTDPNSARAKVALGVWLSPPYRKPDESEKLALAAIALEPWRSSGWQLLAALQASQSRWSDAEATLAKAEATNPDQLQPYYAAGRQLVAENREGARAEAWFRKYLSREPEIGAQSVAGAHWRLGLALEIQGRKPEAIAEIQTAVKLDPKLDPAKKDLKRLKG